MLRLCPDGRHVEIQVRTEEMHQKAEYGLTALVLQKQRRMVRWR